MSHYQVPLQWHDTRIVRDTNKHTLNPGLILFNRSSYRPPLANCATGLLQPSMIKCSLYVFYTLFDTYKTFTHLQILPQI